MFHRIKKALVLFVLMTFAVGDLFLKPLGLFSPFVQEVAAQTILPNDLTITKTLSGSVYPGASIQTIITYANEGATALSGIVVEDLYSSYLTFDGIVSSNPDINMAPVSFSHDATVRRLRRDNISLDADGTGQIVLNYTVSPSLPPHVDVLNQSTVGISCTTCQDPYTTDGNGFSVGYVNPNPIVPPMPYDLSVTAVMPDGDTYMSGDVVDVIYTLSNDTYMSGDVMLHVNYKTWLMDFVGVIDDGGLSLPTVMRSDPILSSRDHRSYVYNTNDTTKLRRNGISIPSGSHDVRLRFVMTNDYTLPTAITATLGIPDAYGLMTTLSDTNDTNNSVVVSPQSPSFDLRITHTVLTGDPGVDIDSYSASGTITFRVSFVNDGPARDNVFIRHDYLSNFDGFVSYTGDRDYGIFTGYDQNSIRSINTSHGGFFGPLSLGTGDSGYIDLTYQVHACGGGDAYVDITIGDNYYTYLHIADSSWDMRDIMDRSREIDSNDNRSLSDSIASDGTCVGYSSYRDHVIGTVTHDATGDLIPGQIVTLTVPWTTYTDSRGGSIKLQIGFDPQVSFLGIVPGVINSTGDAIDYALTTRDHTVADHLVRHNWSESDLFWQSGTGEVWRMDTLAFFATDDKAGCSFGTFPTGRPIYDANQLRFIAYRDQLANLPGETYADALIAYQASGYTLALAHIYALADAQTAVYAYMYQHDPHDAIADWINLIGECEGSSAYNDALAGGATTGQAEQERQQRIDTVATDFSSLGDQRAFFANVWNGDDGGILGSPISSSILGYILDQYYYPNGYSYDVIRVVLSETLQDAFAVTLGVDAFRQLLGQRLMAAVDLDQPIVRQYSMSYADKEYWLWYCPDIACTQQRGKPDTAYDISLDAGEYDAYVDMVLAWTGGLWMPWSGGYAFAGNYYFWGDNVFVDDFSTPNAVAINIPSNNNALSNTLNTMQLQFRIGEAAIASPLARDVQVLQGLYNGSSCDINPYNDSSDSGRACLYGNSRYNDTYDAMGGLSGDIVAGEDNNTGIVLTMGYREPYDLTITKTIGLTGSALPGDVVDVTTQICNNGTSRSDIHLSEDYLADMVFFGQQLSTLGVPYTIDAAQSMITWHNITLDTAECKSVTTIYTVQSFVSSGSQLLFQSSAGSLGSLYQTGAGSVSVTGDVTVLGPLLYTPYGNKEIVSSSFLAGEEIVYRITYENPGELTGFMNLYDIYESGIIFSGIISSSQGLSDPYHDVTTRTLSWTGVEVEPYGSHTIELSFVIAADKLAYAQIYNEFVYDMTFAPMTSITDNNLYNNSAEWRSSYSLNDVNGIIEDDNGDPMNGIQIFIFQGTTLVATGITSGTGWFSIDGLFPGAYTISVAIPGGYVIDDMTAGTVSPSGTMSVIGNQFSLYFDGYTSSADDIFVTLSATSAPVCGNNIQEAGEFCDDGGLNGQAGSCNMACTAILTASMCGNGAIDTGEQCDDNNTTNGDGCSASCAYELPSCSLSIASYQSTKPLALTVQLTGYGFGTMQNLQSLIYGDSSIETNLTNTLFTHSYTASGPYTIQATVANAINPAITATCSVVVGSIPATLGGGGGGLTLDYCPNGDFSGSYFDMLCVEQESIIDDLVVSDALPHPDPIIASMENVSSSLFNPTIDSQCFSPLDKATIYQGNNVSKKFIQSHQLLYSYLLTKWQGTADYRPYDRITREEAARFMVEFAINILCRKPTHTYTNQFTDIEGIANPELLPYIKQSYEYMIFHGDNGGASQGKPTTFRPKDTISADELIAVLVRLVTNEYNEIPGKDWASHYRGFMQDRAVTPLVITSRANTAETIYDLYRYNPYILQTVGYVIVQ